MKNEKLELGAFQDWKVLEIRNYINEETYSCLYELVYKDVVITSYGKRRPALDELDRIKKFEMSEVCISLFRDHLIEKLKNNYAVQFVYQDQFYDIFESCEEGYIYNIYPNDPETIYDEDGELIDEEQLDGGLCTGDEKDVFTFVFPCLDEENIVVAETIEIDVNKTIDILCNGMAYYNYKGISFRLFASKEDAVAYLESNDESLVIEEFESDEELDEYLLNNQTESK